MYATQARNDHISVNKFIDFDKSKSMFYDNLYLCDQKLVVKMPICKRLYSKRREVSETNRTDLRKVKIEPFSLTKYTYLTSY